MNGLFCFRLCRFIRQLRCNRQILRSGAPLNDNLGKFKNNPSVTFGDSSLYTREPCEVSAWSEICGKNNFTIPPVLLCKPPFLHKGAFFSIKNTYHPMIYFQATSSFLRLFFAVITTPFSTNRTLKSKLRMQLSSNCLSALWACKQKGSLV